jgi:GntR family transcriptional regulator/MocR family aminotransferase
MTVERAYSQLTAEGYLRSEDRRGFFVEQLSGSLRHDPPAPTAAPPVTGAALPLPYDFATNVVDANTFPFATWAKLTREVLSSQDSALLSATDPQGLPELREAIVRHLYEFRGIQVAPDQIVVGAGSEVLLSLLVQLLGREAGYAVEDPGYQKTSHLLRKNGAQVSAIPMDSSGIDLAALQDSGAAIVHVTPSHHFPLGTVMPAARRYALLRWAEEQPERYIIEDDYDSEFRFTGRPIPALQSLDHTGRVIYLNTFTKSLSPSLRISYMVLPPALAQRYRRELSFYSSTVPSFEQHILALFMQRGHLERHIWRTRKRYKLRRDALISALKRSGLTQFTRLSGADAGLHLLLTAQNGQTEEALISAAAAAGVRIYPVSACYDMQPPKEYIPTFIMGYARMDEKQLDTACDLLYRSWQALS